MSNQTEAIEDIVMKFQARDLEGIRPYIHSDFTWFDHAGTIVLQGAEIFLEAIERTYKTPTGISTLKVVQFHRLTRRTNPGRVSRK